MTLKTNQDLNQNFETTSLEDIILFLAINLLPIEMLDQFFRDKHIKTMGLYTTLHYFIATEIMTLAYKCITFNLKKYNFIPEYQIFTIVQLTTKMVSTPFLDNVTSCITSIDTYMGLNGVTYLYGHSKLSAVSQPGRVKA